MLLLFAIAASLVVLLARGRSLLDLAGLRFRWGWLLLGALGLQLGAMHALPIAPPWAAARGPLLLATYGLALVGLTANWRLPGLPLLALGAALNFAVMAANGGLMPVTPEALVAARMASLAPSLEPGTPVAGNKDVVLPRDQTLLWPLSDIFLWPPLPRHAVFSVGDMFIALGAALAIQSVKRVPSPES